MKKQINCKEVVWELFTLTAAVAIIAAAVYFFLVPSHASVSSISGLGIILYTFTAFSDHDGPECCSFDHRIHNMWTGIWYENRVYQYLTAGIYRYF